MSNVKTGERAPSGERVQWYRTPLDKKTMAALNARSDWKGFAQSLGHLGLLALTGSLAIYGVGRWPWWAILAILFIHGTAFAFMINAVHELVHRTVFKTRALNDFFASVFAFLGWIHHEMFHTSHMRHHQYTLHHPDDMEVVLPMKVLSKNFFKWGFVNIWGIKGTIQNALRVARGQFGGEWELKLFLEGEPEKRRGPMRWAKFLLIGHAAILTFCWRSL
jgi:fatty acid desaturase